MIMNYPNLISTTIPTKDLKEILDAIDFISEKLSDLHTMTKEEFSSLPKVGKDTVDFVLENLKKAQDNPKLVPDAVEIDEVIKDVELIKTINKILDPLKKLERKLEDSALLAGSEAYLPSIAIYNALKADAIKRKHKQKMASS
jgi:hypothetical protein